VPVPKPKNPADRFPDPCLPRSDSSNASAPNASMRVRRAYRSGNPTITNTCRRGGSRTAPGAVGRVRVAAQGVGGMQIRARHVRLRALYGHGAAVPLPTLRNEQSVAAGLVPAAGKRASVAKRGLYPSGLRVRRTWLHTRACTCATLPCPYRLFGTTNRYGQVPNPLLYARRLTSPATDFPHRGRRLGGTVAFR
jgi:hypothetical protein